MIDAAVLMTFGQPLVVKRIPEPTIGTGEAIVDVAAAPVLHYAAAVFSGERRYLLPTPVVPGCGAIGRVREVGPDATRLRPGDWVFCDPTVRSRDDAIAPDIVLQGWSARGEGGQKLQGYFRDGPFAARIRVPTENAAPIGSINPADAGRWCALNTLLIPYGGLLAAELKAGETLVVSGATGHFGAAAVAASLAMGATGRVIAPGRNAAVLADLARRFGDRIRPVALTGDEAADQGAMKAEGPIDCVLDLLPPSAGAKVARTAVMSVRPGGRVVLMGGVGMLGGEDLALPYPWIMRNDITIRGKWMYPREAVPRMVDLVRAGLLRLEEYTTTAFPLSQANEAVAHAASRSGPFHLTVLCPDESDGSRIAKPTLATN